MIGIEKNPDNFIRFYYLKWTADQYKKNISDSH